MKEHLLGSKDLVILPPSNFWEISGILKFLFVLKIIIVVTTISHSATQLHEVIELEET